MDNFQERRDNLDDCWLREGLDGFPRPQSTKIKRTQNMNLLSVAGALQVGPLQGQRIRKL